MSESITLKLPESLAFRARETALRTQRQVEEVILDWIEHLAVEPPVDSLPDSQVLALCYMQMPEDQQEELSQLLSLNSEKKLARTAQTRLDALMGIYRRGLVRKAQAFKVAVERGLDFGRLAPAGGLNFVSSQ